MEETELPWWYRYNYTKENGVHYAANFQSNNPDYVYWVEKDYLQPTYWSWFSNRSSQYDFNATDRENIKNILERLTKLEEKELPEQEEIDFIPILNKIEEIKQAIPDNTEIIEKLDYIEDFVEEEVKDKEEEQKRKEEEEKKEIEAIKKALMEVDKEDRKNIIEALKQIDMEHEENIINALNSL